MAEGRSWFYLTLWRGTPPDFSTAIEINVPQYDEALAPIGTSDGAEAAIEKISNVDAQVCRNDTVGVDIRTTTEVIWLVG